MTELLAVVASPWSWIGWALLLFGAGPSAVLLVVVRAYPPEHPRRIELVNELTAVPYLKRPVWVAALVPLCLHDGARARRAISSARPPRTTVTEAEFVTWVTLLTPDAAVFRVERSRWLRVRRAICVVTDDEGQTHEFIARNVGPLPKRRRPWGRRG